MSDVRQQLRVVIQDIAEQRHAALEATSSTDFADAILERFDVTPKPVVTAEELGRMAMSAVYENPPRPRERHAEQVGRGMLHQLDAAGLRIVKADDQ